MSTNNSAIDSGLGFWAFTRQCLSEGSREFYQPLLTIRDWWLKWRRIRESLLGLDAALRDVSSAIVRESERHDHEVNSLLKMVIDSEQRERALTEAAIANAQSQISEKVEHLAEAVDRLRGARRRGKVVLLRTGHEEPQTTDRASAGLSGGVTKTVEQNVEFEKVVKEVINVLQDGQRGFADMGEHLKDDTLKRYFFAESLKRANFRAEVENELHRHGVKDVHEEGTVAGSLHRTWGDLRGKFFGADDHRLLALAEQGEDRAKKVYKDALEQELPLLLHQLLSEQIAHITDAYTFVKAHRDVISDNYVKSEVKGSHGKQHT